MNINDIEAGWKTHLKIEFEKPYFKELMVFIENEYKNYNCYPKKPVIFSAFNYCPFAKTKVIIIGQDPYHGLNQANGLCFSVANTVAHPPSLKNIFKEIENDVGIAYPNEGNLERWAKQGVLLLNATLTVRANQPGSHQKKGWEQFTNSVISILSQEHNGLVFLLWGAYAKKKTALINTNKHKVLTSGHPSPLSANRGFWFGNQHFSKTNKLLITLNKSSIKW